VGGHEGYINVGLYPDGRPGELFITMAKEGSTVGGMMDAFGTAISLSLQYGVPLEVLVNKFSHTRFEPMGYTPNPDIPIAKSIVDYIFRWLGLTFLPGYRDANGMARKESSLNETDAAAASAADKSAGAAPVARVLYVPQGLSGNGHSGSRTNNPTENRTENRPMTPAERFASFQADAPACDNCGAITVRSGNCYLCHNCGNSMGCS
jgi:ribonucleoside-diphosphate reductase alpha chain